MIQVYVHMCVHLHTGKCVLVHACLACDTACIPPVSKILTLILLFAHSKQNVGLYIYQAIHAFINISPLK